MFNEPKNRYIKNGKKEFQLITIITFFFLSSANSVATPSSNITPEEKLMGCIVRSIRPLPAPGKDLE